MMSAALIGALVGLAFAVVEYLSSARLSSAPSTRREGAGPGILDLVRKAQLILFPLVGFFAGRWFSAQRSVLMAISRTPPTRCS